MFSKTWKRQIEFKHPEIWSRFEKTNKQGNVAKFVVQTMPPEYLEDVKEMFMDCYMMQETLQVVSGGNLCPENKALFWKILEEIVIPQQVILICVEDTEEQKPKLVGFNMCAVSNENPELDVEAIMKIESTSKIFRIYMEAKKTLVSIEEKYDITEFLGSIALCVHPDYRGLGVAVEILKARIKLCETMGIKVTAALFTGTASQSAAAKAGFFEENAIPYAEISKNTGIPINCSTTHLKYLSYKI